MKNKIIVLTLIAVLILAMAVMAEAPGRIGNKTSPPMAATVDNATYINVNRILMFVTNHGNFARDLSGVFGYDYGTFFPYVADSLIEDGTLSKSINYASGLWIGAIDSLTGDTLVTVAEYSDEYVPGPMDSVESVTGNDTVWTYLSDRPEFKVYKLYSDSLAGNTNADYDNWPVGQGAPVDGGGLPDMIGDQMLWSVFNDADTAQHDNDAGDTDPLGIEIKQTTFGFDRTGPLGNVIFLKMQIYNRGGKTLQNCFMSLWADIDLGQFTDDLVGCDTTLSLGFVYNGTNTDGQFGSAPPAVGYDFFQGPLDSTGNMADTASMWGQKYPGYLNMGMTTFNKYINGTDPDDFRQTYNFMNGLNRYGSQYMYDGNVTTYFVSGDPQTGLGDLDFTPDDRRFMLSTGPITFRPGDSTEILAAIVVGDGLDRISSVGLMKYYDQFAQKAYEKDFVLPKPPATPIVDVAVSDQRISFHWTDTSEVDPGDFPFEGYTILMAENIDGPYKQVGNFDYINGFGDIFDIVYDRETGALEWRRVKKGANLGITHDIVIQKNVITGEDLHNASTYHFKIQAYSYSQPLAQDRTLTSEVTISATPRSPVAGTELANNFADTVAVNNSGVSNGVVLPFVIDSWLFNDHTYQVTFSDTVGIRIDTVYDPNWPGDIDSATFNSYDVAWHLVDVTSAVDDTLMSWQWDQSGDSTFEVIDGILVSVSGPPTGLDSLAYIPEANLPFEGVDWDGSAFGGGIGLLDEFFGSTLGLADLRIVEIRWVDDGTGQSAYCYRRDLGYAYDGFHPNQNLEVWDMTTETPRQINFAFVEDYDLASDQGQSADSIWNPGEQLTIAGEPDAQGGREYFFILKSDYTGIEDATYTPDGACFGPPDADFDCLYAGWVGQAEDTDGKPKVGDIWRIKPYIINSPADTFTFVLKAPSVATSGEQHLDAINVVPNPYYLYGPYDPSPGNHQLKFQHLPGLCTIRIFNLGGDLIRVIEKDDPGNSEAIWDLQTDRNLPISSGIYIYVVEAPGFGTKIGKMAIISEVEVLKIY